jgi:DNA polymerase I-like protein with 3'-5' exonuclease and polymerase domains
VNDKPVETASLVGGLTYGTTLDPYRKPGEAIVRGGRVRRQDAERELYGDGLLGESLAPKKSGELAQKFTLPPFTVLNAREGWWQDRKRAWLSLGIQSELGRGGEGTVVMPATDAAGTLLIDRYRGRTAQDSTLKHPKEPLYQSPDPRPSSHQPAHIIHQPPTLPSSTWTAPQELPSLQSCKQLCIDVETKDLELTTKGPGCRRPDCYVVGLGVGTDDGRRFYFPTRHEGGGNLDENVVWRWAREELNAFKGRIVGAKLDYDLDWLANYGVTLAGCAGFDDVQIAEPLLDEWRYEFNLNALAHDYLGERKQETLLVAAAATQGWTTDDQIKSNLWRLPAMYVGAYAEGDVDLPLRIFPLQQKKLEAEELPTIYSIESRLIPILVAMRRRGVPVNVDRADELRAKLAVERDKWIAEMRRWSSPAAELMAPESFAQHLTARGIKVPMTPKSKKPSVTKGFLEAHAGDPLIDAIAAGRRVNTIINTFLDGHILGHQINGRIHCEFKQLKDDGGGTIARIAAANPNLANVPARVDDRDDPEAPLASLVRSIFLPETDCDWQRDDMSQIEYRLLAHFAVGQGAEEIRQRYKEDPKTDYHKLCAEMCGIDPEDKYRRKQVKGINFAKGYGARAGKLALLIKCSVAEAEDFIKLYETKLPFTLATFNAAQRWAEKNHYVTSILGRRQHFSLWEPVNNWTDNKPPLRREEALQEYGPNIRLYKSYAALNRKMQSSNADIMKKAMVDAWEAGICDVLGPYYLTIYDELDTSIPRTPAGDEAGRELTRIMEQAVKLKVPVLVERERGATWGDCS